MEIALALAFDKDGENRQLPSNMSFEDAKIAAGLE
jgi:hypothetical protein